MLSVLDRKWREHLYEMDYLREGIGLRAMAQRDPLVEYQREGYDMFNAMMDGIREESVGNLFNLQFEIQENPIVEEVGSGAQLAFGGSSPGCHHGGTPQEAAAPAPPRRHGAGSRRVGPPRSARPASAGSAGRPADGLRQEARGSARPAVSRQAAGPEAGTRPTGVATPRRRAAARRRPRSGAAPTAEPAPADVADTVPESTGPQPALPASLEPNRPRNLQYSAPAEGGGVETARRDR